MYTLVSSLEEGLQGPTVELTELSLPAAPNHLGRVIGPANAY